MTRRCVIAALVASLWLAAPVSAQVSIVTTGPADTPAQAVGTAPAPLKEPGNGWNVWANKASTTTLFLAMAASMFGFWFLFQLWQGGFSIVQPEAGGGVAFFAHIGGFVFGALTVRLVAVRRPLNPRY